MQTNKSSCSSLMDASDCSNSPRDFSNPLTWPRKLSFSRRYEKSQLDDPYCAGYITYHSFECLFQFSYLAFQAIDLFQMVCLVSSKLLDLVCLLVDGGWCISHGCCYITNVSHWCIQRENKLPVSLCGPKLDGFFFKDLCTVSTIQGEHLCQ